MDYSGRSTNAVSGGGGGGSGTGVDSSLTAAQILSAESGGSLTAGTLYRPSDDATILYYATAANAAQRIADESSIAAILTAAGYSAGYSTTATKRLAGISNATIEADGNTYTRPYVLHCSSPMLTFTVPASTWGPTINGASVTNNGGKLQLTSGVHSLTNSAYLDAGGGGHIGCYIHITTTGAGGVPSGIYKILSVDSTTALTLDVAYNASVSVTGVVRAANGEIPYLVATIPANFMPTGARLQTFSLININGTGTKTARLYVGSTNTVGSFGSVSIGTGITVYAGGSAITGGTNLWGGSAVYTTTDMLGLSGVLRNLGSGSIHTNPPVGNGYTAPGTVTVTADWQIAQTIQINTAGETWQLEGTEFETPYAELIMAVTYWDTNATGTGSGGSWLNAKSNPALLMSTTLSGASDQEHIFANGSVWPFTANKTEASNTGRLWIHGQDPGNGSKAKPEFVGYETQPALTGWQQIDPATAYGEIPANGGTAVRNVIGTGNLWHTTQSPTNWSGAFRGADGKVFFGRRVKMKASDAQGSGAAPNAPSADWQYGSPAFGGTCLYLTAGNPNTNATMIRRPTAMTDSKMWTITRPLGGLEINGLEFSECDFALNVVNATSSSLISGVWIHDNDFFYCRKGFALIGTGSAYNRVGAGFQNFVFERNRGYVLGQMLFHSTGSAAMNSALIRNNICRYNNQNEGSGALYFDSSYTTDGSRISVYGNWLDSALYDGRYWLDGSALYSEFGSANVDYYNNLITNSKIAVHLNIGTGSHRFHHNVCSSTTSTNSDAAVRIVTADNATGFTDLGEADVYSNIFDRFGMMIGMIELNYWSGTGDRNRVRVNSNIARGRKSLDSNFLYPLQGNNGVFDNNRVTAFKNNFTDFNGTTITAVEYSPGVDQFADTLYGTTRVSDTAIMNAIPVPPDATGLDYNLALKAPTDIGTVNGSSTALRAGKQALALVP